MKLMLPVLLFLNTVALLTFGVLFFAGSLEQFPTKEQESSSRLVWGILFACMLVSEVYMARVLKKQRK